METKNLLKSNTVRGLILVAIPILMQMCGIGSEEVAQTWDTIGQSQDSTTVNISPIMQVLGLALAGYGRATAKQPLHVRKKKEPKPCDD